MVADGLHTLAESASVVGVNRATLYRRLSADTSQLPEGQDA